MLNKSWIEKLQVECIEEEDGSMTIRIHWDETDPDLSEWTSWGEQLQRTFVLNALNTAVNGTLSHVT